MRYRRATRAKLALAACTEHGSGGGGGGDDGGTQLVGECAPAADASTLSPASFGVNIQSCTLASELDVVGSLQEWQALLGSCSGEPPPEVDFATQRVALVHPDCANFDVQFAADAPDEVVVGILERPSGACLRSMIGVPLPRSAKPVRVATCREECPTCPPVP